MERRLPIKFGLVQRGNSSAVYKMCFCSECQILDLPKSKICCNLNECLLPDSGHVCYCLDHIHLKSEGRK